MRAVGNGQDGKHGKTAAYLVPETDYRLPLSPVLFAVTTQSVSRDPQFEHRKRSRISGTFGASRSQNGAAIPFS